MYNQKIILGGARKLPVLDRMTPSEFFFPRQQERILGIRRLIFHVKTTRRLCKSRGGSFTRGSARYWPL